MTISDQAADFIAKLPREGRILALDVGSKTIGLAMSDARRTIATPLITIERKKFTADMAALKKIAEQNRIAGLVIGMPINMDGTNGPRTQSVRDFTREMDKHLSLPTLFWDERMSTMAVERTMLEADLSRARRAELVDKMAATYILQGALDRIQKLQVTP